MRDEHDAPHEPSAGALEDAAWLHTASIEELAFQLATDITNTELGPTDPHPDDPTGDYGYGAESSEIHRIMNKRRLAVAREILRRQPRPDTTYPT